MAGGQVRFLKCFGPWDIVKTIDCMLKGSVLLNLPSSNAFNPLPDNKILDRYNLKQSADDNFKFHENSRKFSKHVENTVGKGAISPLPRVFSKGLFPRGIKRWHCVGMG